MPQDRWKPPVLRARAGGSTAVASLPGIADPPVATAVDAVFESESDLAAEPLLTRPRKLTPLPADF